MGYSFFFACTMLKKKLTINQKKSNCESAIRVTIYHLQIFYEKEQGIQTFCIF